MLQSDFNPILDEGAPTSTGGIDNAMNLADALGIESNLQPVSNTYLVGWGEAGANPKPVLYTWSFIINDIDATPTAFQFDLVDGQSPLIIGLDQKKYANTLNNLQPPCITFNRPQDQKAKTFYTYLKHDNGGYERLYLELVSHCKTTTHSLLARTGRNIELNGIKKIHRFTHASAKEMFNLLKDAKMTTALTQNYCKKISSACDICAQSGRPHPRKKISITHVNEAFNQSLQVDFLVVYLNEKNILF